MAVNSIRGLGIQDNLDCLVKCGLARVEIASNEPFAAPPATSAESILEERFLNLCISRRGDTGQRAGIITFSLAPRVTAGWVLRKRRDELGWGKAVRFRVVRPAPETEHPAVSSEAIPLSIRASRLPRLCPVPACLVAHLGVGSYELVLLTLPFIFLLSLENEWACYHQNPLS
jgi:hypothetical protein